MNKKVSFVFALLLVALPFLIASRTAPLPVVRSGELELFFPAGSQTAGGYQEFSVPFSARPIVVLSVNSQDYPMVTDTGHTGLFVPSLDYFANGEGLSVLAALESPVTVDTVFTVSWMATLPNP